METHVKIFLPFQVRIYSFIKQYFKSQFKFYLVLSIVHHYNKVSWHHDCYDGCYWIVVNLICLFTVFFFCKCRVKDKYKTKMEIAKERKY